MIILTNVQLNTGAALLVELIVEICSQTSRSH